MNVFSNPLNYFISVVNCGVVKKLIYYLGL